MIVVVGTYNLIFGKDSFLRYKLLWEMVKEVAGYIKFYHHVNKKERFSPTLLIRVNKDVEMSWVFIIFCFISTFSWEVGGRRELVKKCSHTSIVFILADYLDHLCPHSDRISPLTWQWCWSLLAPILLLLHTLIWHILCNRKTRWHPPPVSNHL